MMLQEPWRSVNVDSTLTVHQGDECSQTPCLDLDVGMRDVLAIYSHCARRNKCVPAVLNMPMQSNHPAQAAVSEAL